MKRIVSRFLALCCLILCGFLLATTLSRHDSPPEGFPITVLTNGGETIYFKAIHIDFVDAWNRDKHNSPFFRLETDAGGQLTVSKKLDGVLVCEVLQLPNFSSEPKKDLPDTSNQEKRFDPASMVARGDFRNSNPNRNQSKSDQPQTTPLLCRVRLTFATGRIFEGNVTVYPDRNDSRVWGVTPEGTRHMTLSDIVSIELPEEEKKGR